jgi:hypothetical protein
MAGFQVIIYGRFWVITKGQPAVVSTADWPLFKLRTFKPVAFAQVLTGRSCSMIS